MLSQEIDPKSTLFNGERSRSMSANSTMLLNRPGIGERRQSVGLESISIPGASHTGSAPYTPTTPGGVSTFSYLPGATHNNLRTAEPADPFYRPPRQRRVTMDLYSQNMEASSPGRLSRSSWTSADWTKRWSARSPEHGSPDPGEGPSISGRATPLEEPGRGTSRAGADRRVERRAPHRSLT